MITPMNKPNDKSDVKSDDKTDEVSWSSRLKGRRRQQLNQKKKVRTNLSSQDVRNQIDMELYRAKRHQRPLSVAALSVNGRSKDLEAVSLQLANKCRALDFVVLPPAGSLQPLLVFYPETSIDDLVGLKQRVFVELKAMGIYVAFATFPEDGVWFHVLAETAIARLEPVGVSSTSY